jgi:DNA-binding NarL/FixJ family response regulator
MTSRNGARAGGRSAAIHSWRTPSPATTDLTRVVVVHSHTMMGRALRAALGDIDDLDVVGVAETVDAAVERAPAPPPHVVVIDLRSADGDGAGDVARLLAAWPEVRVLVLATAADYRSVVAAIEAGAAGILLTHQPLEDLIDGIRAARAGQTVVAPSLVPALLAGISPAALRLTMLNRREVDVLQLLAEGLSTIELAAHMGVSVNTVRNNIQSALTRLGAHSKLEAVSIALREGIITPPARSA